MVLDWYVVILCSVTTIRIKSESMIWAPDSVRAVWNWSKIPFRKSTSTIPERYLCHPPAALRLSDWEGPPLYGCYMVRNITRILRYYLQSFLEIFIQILQNYINAPRLYKMKMGDGVIWRRSVKRHHRQKLTDLLMQHGCITTAKINAGGSVVHTYWVNAPQL